ncbi:hypothetical protein DFH28DRAFT_21701 [Melampsora americana]|nr:hypothetical protein DFH28DRAFT_21701 [Melampsora americana]
MQTTFEDHHSHSHSGSKNQTTHEDNQVLKNESNRLKTNEEKHQTGEPTQGGSAGRAQVGSQDPKDFDIKAGGQGDHLPTKEPMI